MWATSAASFTNILNLAVTSSVCVSKMMNSLHGICRNGTSTIRPVPISAAYASTGTSKKTLMTTPTILAEVKVALANRKTHVWAIMKIYHLLD